MSTRHQPALPGYNVIGSCSLCGGPVCIPQVWNGVIPPTPFCGHCGAVKADNYGPVIELRYVPLEALRESTTSGATEAKPREVDDG